MITYPKNRTLFDLFKCCICQCDIQDNSHVYQSVVNYAIICEECNKTFSKDDIDLIINIFTAYGGYFGKYRGSETYFEDIIIRLLNSIDNDNASLSKLNVELLHRALLHGITPKQVIKMLKKYVED